MSVKLYHTLTAQQLQTIYNLIVLFSLRFYRKVKVNELLAVPVYTVTMNVRTTIKQWGS